MELCPDAFVLSQVLPDPIQLHPVWEGALCPPDIFHPVQKKVLHEAHCLSQATQIESRHLPPPLTHVYDFILLAG